MKRGLRNAMSIGGLTLIIAIVGLVLASPGYLKDWIPAKEVNSQSVINTPETLSEHQESYNPSSPIPKIIYDYNFQITFPDKETAEDFKESSSTLLEYAMDDAISTEKPKIFGTFVDRVGLQVIIYDSNGKSPEDNLRKIYAAIEDDNYYEIVRSEFAKNAKGIQFVDSPDQCSLNDLCSAG